MYIYIYSNPQKDRKVKYGTIFLQNSEVYGTSVFWRRNRPRNIRSHSTPKRCSLSALPDRWCSRAPDTFRGKIKLIKK